MKVWSDERRRCLVIEPETDQELSDLMKRLGPFDKDGGPTRRSPLWEFAAEWDGKRLRTWSKEK